MARARKDLGTVGGRITHFREALDMEMKQLAAATGIKYNRITKFEANTSEPYFWEMLLIAVHLQKPVNYFDPRQPLSYTITVHMPGASDAAAPPAP